MDILYEQNKKKEILEMVKTFNLYTTVSLELELRQDDITRTHVFQGRFSSNTPKFYSSHLNFKVGVPSVDTKVYNETVTVHASVKRWHWFSIEFSRPVI